ncbi:MAG: hypothetical protein U0519_02125 [Candidatus Gracilibacteria bacterium]
MKKTSLKTFMSVLSITASAVFLNGCTTNPATGPLNTGNTPAENTLPKGMQVALNSSQEKAASQQETQELNPLLKNRNTGHHDSGIPETSASRRICCLQKLKSRIQTDRSQKLAPAGGYRSGSTLLLQ